ncbi:hypothetical protein HPP92_003332, partial [Vanilla planifolia]
CRFLGPEVATGIILKQWKRNGGKWSNDRPFIENLSLLLETKLHGPPKDCGAEDNQIECGICYAQYLPLVDDLGNNSRTTPDYTCNNPCCSRAFHTICLRDWLCSITTTRQSFDVLFGNCPYCLDVVAVTTNCQLPCEATCNEEGRKSFSFDGEPLLAGEVLIEHSVSSSVSRDLGFIVGFCSIVSWSCLTEQ